MNNIIKEIKELKENKRIAIVIRHGDRDKIPANEFGNDVLLNEKGVENAINFGKELKQYKINRIYTSPIERCVQTAQNIKKSIGKEIEIVLTTKLGDPGLHVFDAEKTGAFYLKYGFDKMYSDFIMNIKIPGVPTKKDLEINMKNFLEKTASKNGLTLYISHDSLIAFFENANSGKIYTKENWVNYLEGFTLTF